MEAVAALLHSFCRRKGISLKKISCRATIDDFHQKFIYNFVSPISQREVPFVISVYTISRLWTILKSMQQNICG